jgi:hypothetical protein
MLIKVTNFSSSFFSFPAPLYSPLQFHTPHFLHSKTEGLSASLDETERANSVYVSCIISSQYLPFKIFLSNSDPSHYIVCQLPRVVRSPLLPNV